MLNRYYVYMLFDPRVNRPFYVGKGCDDRAMVHTTAIKNGRRSENPHKDRTIRQILDSGTEPEVQYVATNLTEDAAYDLERELIQQYGRRLDGGVLTNICIDGRPPPPTPERIEMVRAKLAGKTLTELLGPERAEQGRNARSRSYQLSNHQFQPGNIPWNAGTKKPPKVLSEEDRSRKNDAVRAWRDLKRGGPPREPLSTEEVKRRAVAATKAWRKKQRERLKSTSSSMEI